MAFPEILEMLQEEYKTLQFENYNLKQQLLTAQATLKLNELKNSGEIIKNDEFKLLDPNDASANVTRTGKPIDDLDVSDKTAMNYINTTTKPTGPDGNFDYLISFILLQNTRPQKLTLVVLINLLY